MHEGQFETGQDFAWHWVNEICEETKNIPSWVTIDYEDISGSIDSMETMRRLIVMAKALYHIFNSKIFLSKMINSNCHTPHAHSVKSCV